MASELLSLQSIANLALALQQRNPLTPLKSNTSSGSATLKLLNNLHNVRASLAESSMLINDGVVWDAYPTDFKPKIMDVVARDAIAIRWRIGQRAR